jgi:HEAT repeat protein
MSRYTHSLGQIGSSKALNHLIEKIHDEDRSVREAAIDALGVIKDKKALEPLLDKEARKRG